LLPYGFWGGYNNPKTKNKGGKTMKTKTLSLILSLICLFTLITGCDGIGLEDIHLNLGGDDSNTDDTTQEIRCQLTLQTRVVTVTGAYVYPVMVIFMTDVLDAGGSNVYFHDRQIKYTDSKGYISFTAPSFNLPPDRYAIITVYVQQGDEEGFTATTASMSFTYAEISQHGTLRSGGLITYAKFMTVIKG
jgi:hypothetical protein